MMISSVTWLQLIHPAVPNSITTLPDGPSLLDEFSDVPLVDPVPMDSANHKLTH